MFLNRRLFASRNLLIFVVLGSWGLGLGLGVGAWGSSVSGRLSSAGAVPVILLRWLASHPAFGIPFSVRDLAMAMRVCV